LAIFLLLSFSFTPLFPSSSMSFSLHDALPICIYEVGRRVKDQFAFLEAHDMTIEAVITKSMWLLAQKCDHFEELQEKFYRQINLDRKSTRLNSSHVSISYAVFCLKKKK